LKNIIFLYFTMLTLISVPARSFNKFECVTYHDFIKLENGYCPQSDLETQIKKGELVVNDLLNVFNKKITNCSEHGALGPIHYTHAPEKVLIAIIYYSMINKRDQYIEELLGHNNAYVNFLVFIMGQNLKSDKWLKRLLNDYPSDWEVFFTYGNDFALDLMGDVSFLSKYEKKKFPLLNRIGNSSDFIVWDKKFLKQSSDVYKQKRDVNINLFKRKLDLLIKYKVDINKTLVYNLDLHSLHGHNLELYFTKFTPTYFRKDFKFLSSTRNKRFIDILFHLDLKDSRRPQLELGLSPSLASVLSMKRDRRAYQYYLSKGTPEEIANDYKNDHFFLSSFEQCKVVRSENINVPLSQKISKDGRTGLDVYFENKCYKLLFNLGLLFKKDIPSPLFTKDNLKKYTLLIHNFLDGSFVDDYTAADYPKLKEVYDNILGEIQVLVAKKEFQYLPPEFRKENYKSHFLKAEISLKKMKIMYEQSKTFGKRNHPSEFIFGKNSYSLSNYIWLKSKALLLDWSDFSFKLLKTEDVFSDEKDILKNRIQVFTGDNFFLSIKDNIIKYKRSNTIDSKIVSEVKLPSKEIIYSATLFKNNIYILTKNGLLKYSLSGNLIDKMSLNGLEKNKTGWMSLYNMSDSLYIHYMEPNSSLFRELYITGDRFNNTGFCRPSIIKKKVIGKTNSKFTDHIYTLSSIKAKAICERFPLSPPVTEGYLTQNISNLDSLYSKVSIEPPYVQLLSFISHEKRLGLFEVRYLNEEPLYMSAYLEKDQDKFKLTNIARYKDLKKDAYKNYSFQYPYVFFFNSISSRRRTRFQLYNSLKGGVGIEFIGESIEYSPKISRKGH